MPPKVSSTTGSCERGPADTATARSHLNKGLCLPPEIPKKQIRGHVQHELSIALQNRTSGMLAIGRLLNEAKALVDHGAWLPWLRRHTGLPARTAQQYMVAAAWADAKNATVAHLDLDYLSPGAIYALASGRYTGETVERVLDAAAVAQRHINESDVKEIAKSGAQAAILQEIEANQKAAAEAAAEDEACEADRVKWEAAQQAEEAEAERERTEVEAILDGGPDTDLPPASEPVVASSETFHVATLERTIEALRSIMTKPLSTFRSAKISPNDIEQVTAFLQKVAKQIAEERRAA